MTTPQSLKGAVTITIEGAGKVRQVLRFPAPVDGTMALEAVRADLCKRWETGAAPRFQPVEAVRAVLRDLVLEAGMPEWVGMMLEHRAEFARLLERFGNGFHTCPFCNENWWHKRGCWIGEMFFKLNPERAMKLAREIASREFALAMGIWRRQETWPEMMMMIPALRGGDEE